MKSFNVSSVNRDIVARSSAGGRGRVRNIEHGAFDGARVLASAVLVKPDKLACWDCPCRVRDKLESALAARAKPGAKVAIQCAARHGISYININGGPGGGFRSDMNACRRSRRFDLDCIYSARGIGVNQ